MNLRTTILLLLVLAALGAAAWFLRPTGEVDPWAKPTEQLTESQHPTLLQTLGVDANRITKIMLAPSTRAPLTLARSGDHWLIQEPVVWKADTNAVEALILEPIRQTVVLETRALEPYAAAADTLELTDDAGHSTSITLGQDLGAGSGLLYADKTYRTNNRLRALMGDLRSSSALTALVDPQIDFPPLARLSALTVDSGNSHTRVVRGKQGFTLDQPGAPRADAAAVAAYGAELSKLRLAEIPQETASGAAQGFDKSPVKVTMEETGGAKTTLEVGGPTGPDLKRYFIRLTPPSGAPLVGAVETAQVRALPQGANFFRDWRIFLTKPADLRRMRVEHDGNPTLDVALGSDDPRAKAAMDALTALKPTGAAQAIAKPTHRLVLTDAFGREEVFTLSLGTGACAIQRKGDAEGFVVPKAQLEALVSGGKAPTP